MRRTGRTPAATPADHAADGAPTLDGQETIHRPTGHFGREQRKLHAERGQEPADARRNRHDGRSLRQNRRPDRGATDRSGRRSLHEDVQTNLQIR